MSKLSSDTVKEAVTAILTHANGEGKRGFLQTVEIQIALKNYDPSKDKPFTGTLRLPSAPRPRFSVAVIGDAKHIQECKELNIPAISIDDLKKLNKQKKLVKKFAESYDAFLASSSLIRNIPRILGPGLSKAGKFPSVLGQNDNIVAKVEEVKASAKFRLKSKKCTCVSLAVGNVGQKEEDVTTNITLAVNFMVSLLPKNWQQVKRIYTKSTMGPVHRIFGF